MIVYGILKHEEQGQILHKGTLDACKDFVKSLEHKDDYYSLNICQDNGMIEERAITNMKGKKKMIVFGTLKGEEFGNVLFKGNMEECKVFVRGVIPYDYDSLNIDKENGEIEKRYIVNGGITEDFKELIS